MKIVKFRLGSTIIEVLIAATLISVAVLAGLALGSTSQKQTDFSRDLNTATGYNNQALDWLRNLRSEMGWRSLINELTLDTTGSSVIYCLSSLPSSTDFAALTNAPCDPTNPNHTIPGTAFVREATLTMSGSPVDHLDIVMTTYWGAKAHFATAEAALAEW